MSENNDKNRIVNVNELETVSKNSQSEEQIKEENEKLEQELSPDQNITKDAYEEVSGEVEEPKEEVKEEVKEEIPKMDPAILEALKKKKEAKEEVGIIKATATRDRSLCFFSLGVGQAGNRISEVFYKKGYDALAFNTAKQDLEFIEIPDNKKVFLPYGALSSGAGKSLENGAMAIDENADMILTILNDNINDSHEMILISSSLGGGTGSGGLEGLISLVSTLDKPIGVIVALPTETEDSLSKHNSIVTLAKLAKMASSDIISTLVVVDNSKIELIYPNLSKAEFWEVANESIVQPLHLFNSLSSQATKYDSLDGADFARLVTTGDLTIYGMLEVEDYMETTALAEAVLEGLEEGLLASDFNLKETRFGGYIVVAHPNTLRELPSVNLDYCNHMIAETCENPQLVRGVYELQDMEVGIVRVYTMLTGLGLPTPRIDSLKTQATEQMEKIKQKEKTRASRMTVDYQTGNETESKTQEVHRKIKQKKSGFGKITGGSKRIIDRRKR